MSNSSVRQIDAHVSGLDDASILTTTNKSNAASRRNVSGWNLMQPLIRLARGTVDTVNSSLDAVRGRYDR